jgi:hypothetical protein
MDAVLKICSEIFDQVQQSNAGPDYFFQEAHADEYAAYYTSMYLIQDTGEAVWTHMRRGFSSDPMAAYLEFWGVMQALVIQQDAIREAHKAVLGALPATEALSGWKAIRDIRNLCAGHPANRSAQRKTQRAFMGRHFGGYAHIQYELWEEGSTTPRHPSFDLRRMIDGYDLQAAEVLDGVLVALRARWPVTRV